MPTSSDSDTQAPLPDDSDFRYLARLVDILHEQRAAQGLTKRELSLKSGTAIGAIGRAERYERFPGIPVLRKISRALNLSWVDLCQQAEDRNLEK